MTGVRWHRTDGWEGRCDVCAEWLPLDPEFWPVKGRGLRWCRACENERRRIIQASRRAADPAHDRAMNRAHYALNRTAKLAKAAARRRERRLTEPGYIERERAWRREYVRARRARGLAA